MRIGHGFDAHQLAEGRRLVLCGVEVPYRLGLAGHSDADVATHALADALLGAAALGDIGQHFPDTDAAYANACSIELLRRVVAMVGEAGYRVVNVDVSIVAERPRIAPHVKEMRSTLAEAIGVGTDAVSVKGTTTEGMGFTGRGEGIAAHAVAVIEVR